MKAAVYSQYGAPDVLQVKEVATPTPHDNEVLIKVKAATVTLFDCWMRQGTGPAGFGLISRIASGFNKPKQPILGTELSGVVQAVGAAVTRFKVGDPVFGFTGARLGAYAEYICLPENSTLATLPENLSYQQSAAVPYGSLTALFFLRAANIQPNQKVLVFGASGCVGTAAVQIAKHFGAEVTGVCSTSKVDMVKSLGADKVIDYKTEDFSKQGVTYDVIFDTIGKSPFAESVKSLKKGGTYLFATFGLLRMLQIFWLKLTSNRKVGPLATVEEHVEDLVFLRDLIEAGEIKPFIDRCYPLEEIAEAHRYVESGRKRGNVIITLANGDLQRGAS